MTSSAEPSAGPSAPAPLPSPAPVRVAGRWVAVLAVLSFACTGVTSYLLIAKRIDLKRADITVPFYYGHDALIIQCWVKTLVDTGWWTETDRLGAPYRHQMHDFPTNPSLHFFALKLLLAVSRDPAVLMNLLYLLGYPLAGLAAHAALRTLRVSHPLAVVGGVLYAHQPYHYWRNIAHLFLGTYYMLPLVVLVLVWVYRNESLFIGRNDTGRLRLRVLNWRTLAAVAILLAEGFDFPYYPIFAGFFLLTTGLAGFAVHRDRLILVRTTLLLGVLVGAFAVNMSPNLAYYKANGTNPAADHITKRPWADAETFGLVPVQMLLPAMNHPIPWFHQLQAKYYSKTSMSSSTGAAAVGTFGAVGFFVLLIALVCGSRSRTDRGRILFLFGLLLVLGILLCAPGGFGTLFNLLSVGIARTYDRMSIFLAFFCVAATCCVLDSAVRWGISAWEKGNPRRRDGFLKRWGTLGGWAWVWAAAAGLVFLGYKDQTGETYLPMNERRRAVEEEYRSDRAFVAQVEEAIPTGAMVFQLPYISFGSYSNALGKMEPYAHFMPYVHSHATRWSFGAMYGRAEEAELAKIGRLPPAEMLPVLLAYGYAGVSIDRFGYADHGAAVEAAIRQTIGAEPIVSPNGRMAFYRLAGYEKAVRGERTDADWQAWRDALRERIWSIPLLSWDPVGFDAEEVSKIPGWGQFRWARSPGVLKVTNPTPRPLAVRVRFTVFPFTPSVSAFTFDSPAGYKVYVLPADGLKVDEAVELPPGESTFTFGCDAPPYVHPSRTIVYRVEGFTAEPSK